MRRLGPAVVGLVAGVLACVLLVGRFDGAAPGTRDDLEPGDIVQAALDSFADGDHVVVAPGAAAYLPSDRESDLEETIAAEDAPLYVLVVDKSWNSGYAQAGHAFDQMLANTTVDGVLVIWEQAPDSAVEGYVGLPGLGRLPSVYDLEDLGITLTPEEQDAYEAVDQYEMNGDVDLRMAEWARALPDGITDVEPEPADADTRHADTVFGVVAGVFVGAFGGLLVWIVLGLARVRSGRTFRNRPAPAASGRGRRGASTTARTKARTKSRTSSATDRRSGRSARARR